MQGVMCINPSESVAKREFPFSREDNPLASQLIFLAEVVGAKIAAAAASAALQELFEKDSIVHQELLYSAAMSAGIQVSAPQMPGATTAGSAAQLAAGGASSADQNGAAAMDADDPTTAAAGTVSGANGAANGVNGHGNENVVQDTTAVILPERLHAASTAAFIGASMKAKLLAEAEEVILGGHAMTVLECMTQKMVIKNKYLTDVENEITSVHGKLVETRAAAVRSRDSIAAKKELLKKEKQLLAAAEKKHGAELAAAGKVPKASAAAKPAETPSTAAAADAGAVKRPAEGDGNPAAKKVTKPAEKPSTAAAATTAAADASAPGAKVDATMSQVQQLLLTV